MNDHRIRMWVGLKNKGGCSFRYSLLGTSLFCTMKETIKVFFFFILILFLMRLGLVIYSETSSYT